MIYFIKSEHGPIKIGTSKRLSARLKTLSADTSFGRLSVIGVMDGGFPEEKKVHWRFRLHRHPEGEWFDPAEELIAFIAAEARPWDGIDEAAPYDSGTNAIKIDRRVRDNLKWCAEHEGLTITELASRMLDEEIGKSGRLAEAKAAMGIE